jgi:heterodisulfide reductase subunit C
VYKISRKNLPSFFKASAEKQTLYLPVKSAGQTDFAAWTEDAEIDLEALKTVKSAKEAFFPQSETLYTCIRDGKKIKIEPQELINSDFILFGVRACDVKGIQVLDKVFLSEPVDTFYASRREHGIIIASACNEPELSCFCKVFGTDCAEPDGADVVTWLTEDELFLKPVTDKGLRFIDSVKHLLTESDDSAVNEIKKEIRQTTEMIPNMHLSLDGWGKDENQSIFNSPLWEDLYKPCLACGTCTFVCPTCQCYDIKDYNTGSGVMRYRCWDSCMYSDFTLMAHGNNRTSQMQRFRQRFMHKLVYFPTNNDGMFSCVGCGRCIDKCPSSLNIVKVIKAFEKAGDK